MKLVVLIVVVVVTMALLGWLKFGNSPTSATMSIDKQQVKEDTAKAVETVKGAVNDVSHRMRPAESESQPVVQ